MEVTHDGPDEPWGLEEQERTNPQKLVLASVLRDPDTIHVVRPLLQEDDFVIDSHIKCWQAMGNLAARGEAIECVSLYQELNRITADRQKNEPARNAERQVWMRFVAELADCLPTGANAEYYAHLARGEGIYRRILKELHTIRRDVMDRIESPDVAIESAITRLAAVAGPSRPGGPVMPLAEAIDQAMDDYEKRHRGEDRPLPTGIAPLDDELGGGFRGGQLITLAALTGVGKTVLANQFSKSIAASGKQVLFCSFEMVGRELSARMLVTEAKINNSSVRGQPTDVDMVRLRQAADQLKPLPISYMRIPNATVAAVEPIVARLSRSAGGIGLVVLDYLQLMGGSNRRQSRQEQVAEVSRANKLMAGKYDCAVLQLSQFNRGASQPGERPRMHQLKEAGSIEQDSDTVLILHEEDREGTAHSLFVDKQRNGPSDVKVRLRNLPGQFRFTPAACY